MSKQKYDPGFKVNKNVIYFFLGAGISAVWNLQESVHMPLKNLIIDGVLWGIACLLIIRGSMYIFTYIKRVRRKKSHRHKSNNYRQRAKSVKEKGKVSW